MQPDSPNDLIIDTPFDSALSERYLVYALSTITARSLPDVRDGLKPVHRRLLWAMRLLKLDPASAYKKCARVVGDVIGKYHPHGDQSVYDAMVRLSQDWALRYPLVDGQGNFGNIDGDNAAAYRYTEARLTATAARLMAGLDEGTVDYRATYNGEEEEPEVFPGLFPNLLANGASGIAVGMATSIPPHNVGELIEAASHLIDNPGAEDRALMDFVTGPDFPTGGVLVDNRETITHAYATGRGSFRLRAKIEVEKEKGGGWHLLVHEIPYGVQKGRLIEQIADLIALKKLPILADVRDESDTAVRIVLEPRSRTVDRELLLESLFKLTELQAEAILDMRLRRLRKLEEMEIGRERAALAKEREGLAALIESPARQRSRLKKELAALKEAYASDERRTVVMEQAPARELDWTQMIEKEPITVILSQRGWIRSMRGHLARAEYASLKFREGDELWDEPIYAQTTDRLLVAADNGRVYTLGGDKLPGGRGFGEPIRLTIDLEAEAEIVAMMVVRPEHRLLVASSDGRGFVTTGEATLAETRKGKQLVNLRPGAKVALLKPVPGGADAVAVIGENRKMLVFRLDELPELGRGSGVQLQRYRDGGLSDAMAFAIAEGISWPLGGDSGRVRSETDLTPWRAIRGASGRIAPNGFPRSNRFEAVPPVTKVGLET